MSEVTFSLGHTIKLREYESLRVDVSITTTLLAPPDHQAIESAMFACHELLAVHTEAAIRTGESKGIFAKISPIVIEFVVTNAYKNSKGFIVFEGAQGQRAYGNFGRFGKVLNTDDKSFIFGEYSVQALRVQRAGAADYYMVELVIVHPISE